MGIFIDTLELTEPSVPILDSPVFTTDSRHFYDVLENATLSLGATARAKPTQIAYKWYKNGVAISNDDNRYYLNENRLNITSTHRSDKGLYLLEARNHIGVANVTFNVSVKCKRSSFS